MSTSSRQPPPQRGQSGDAHAEPQPPAAAPDGRPRVRAPTFRSLAPPRDAPHLQHPFRGGLARDEAGYAPSPGSVISQASTATALGSSASAINGPSYRLTTLPPPEHTGNRSVAGAGSVLALPPAAPSLRGGGGSMVSGLAASSVMSWPALGVAVGSSSISLSSAGFYPSPPHAHRHMDPLAAALQASSAPLQRSPASAQLPARIAISLRQLQQGPPLATGSGPGGAREAAAPAPAVV